MDSQDMPELSVEDVRQFKVNGKPVVRLYKRGNQSGWSAGFLKEIEVSDRRCYLHLERIVRYGHSKMVNPRDPNCMFIAEDLAIRKSVVSEETILLEDPRTIVSDEGVIIIQSHDWIVMISKKLQDVYAAERLITSAK